MTKNITNSTKYIKRFDLKERIPVNNVIHDREEMFAAATDRNVWGFTIS
jgi:hypothetical protein